MTSQSLTIIKYSKTYWKYFRKSQDERICGKKTGIRFGRRSNFHLTAHDIVYSECRSGVCCVCRRRAFQAGVSCDGHV